ncbi:hypothetical protein IWZ00DRAFT_293904 [Phyllosticta capitalensis]
MRKSKNPRDRHKDSNDDYFGRSGGPYGTGGPDLGPRSYSAFVPSLPLIEPTPPLNWKPGDRTPQYSDITRVHPILRNHADGQFLRNVIGQAIDGRLPRGLILPPAVWSGWHHGDSPPDSESGFRLPPAFAASPYYDKIAHEMPLPTRPADDRSRGRTDERPAVQVDEPQDAHPSERSDEPSIEGPEERPDEPSVQPPEEDEDDDSSSSSSDSSDKTEVPHNRQRRDDDDDDDSSGGPPPPTSSAGGNSDPEPPVPDSGDPRASRLSQATTLCSWQGTISGDYDQHPGYHALGLALHRPSGIPSFIAHAPQRSSPLRASELPPKDDAPETSSSQTRPHLDEEVEAGQFISEAELFQDDKFEAFPVPSLSPTLCGSDSSLDSDSSERLERMSFQHLNERFTYHGEKLRQTWDEMKDRELDLVMHSIGCILPILLDVEKRMSSMAPPSDTTETESPSQDSGSEANDDTHFEVEGNSLARHDSLLGGTGKKRKRFDAAETKAGLEAVEEEAFPSTVAPEANGKSLVLDAVKAPPRARVLLPKEQSQVQEVRPSYEYSFVQEGAPAWDGQVMFSDPVQKALRSSDGQVIFGDSEELYMVTR